ncbi:MAG: lipid-A-disaccharide synthase [Bdellovibrionales bacterium]|nr:lipid-A-disaccharide synthase [Bdellovibrionales bacterium]
MKIAISAGDPSGDEHAANVVTALRARDPRLTFFGMGGSKMRAVGVQTVVDSESEASVMGFGDVVRALPKLISAFRKVKDSLAAEKPDLLLLVDYQDFNIRLAKAAKELGIRTLFYIAPTIWAWRPKRVELFKKYVDHLAVIFPFEVEVFQRLGYERVTYIGHPLIDSNEFCFSDVERLRLREQFGYHSETPIVALFPGSRKHEIQRHLKVMLQAFQLAKKRIPELQAVVPVPPSIPVESLDNLLSQEPAIRIIPDGTRTVFGLGNFGIIKSGTSNLQAAFAGLPFTMVYSASWFTELMVRLFVNRRTFSIVNIIRPDTVQEIIQQNFTTERIASELFRLCEDPAYRNEIQSGLLSVVDILKSSTPNGANSAERLAHLIFKNLPNTSHSSDVLQPTSL